MGYSQTKVDKWQPGEPLSVSFYSEDSKVKGVFYPAVGAGPFPAVILSHGYPGNNKDVLGLGQRFMKEGIHALAFNYRGSWRSEGLYTLRNSLRDVRSAIEYLKSPSMVERFSIDVTNIAIAGYSFGGGMALLGSLYDSSVRKVVDVAGMDLCELARQVKKDDRVREALEKTLEEGMSTTGMIRSHGVKGGIEELLETMDEYDLVKHAEELAEKNLLLIAGWQDNQVTLEANILPLYRALQKCGAKNVEIEVFNSHHQFTNVRDALASRIISWIKKKQ